MTIDDFWRHIDAASWSDPYEHADRLSQRLVELEVNDVLDFDYLWHVVRNRAYSASLWAAANRATGRQLLDDEFEYFIGWLILQGEVVFDRIVANPDGLSTLALPGEPFYEGYPGFNAWLHADESPTSSDGWDRFVSAAEERHGDYFAIPELD